MNASGGSAAEIEAQKARDEEGAWTEHLRAELAAAVRRCVVTNARLGLVLRGEGTAPCDLAKAAADASLAAGQVAGFAAMLCKATTTILLLSFM